MTPKLNCGIIDRKTILPLWKGIQSR